MSNPKVNAATLKELSKAILSRTNAMEASSNKALYFKKQNPEQAIEELALAVRETVMLLQHVGSALRNLHDVPHTILRDG